ncbi:Digestive organ expansion factor, predicted [Heracleum sosnowskyi]|uniref:Digestive organ expansion factor, predicted n=1 Tax=Heracleum sosnowskyi TaxID=360622 RepID=A0AAD8IYC5_9APIA|nr:Digestive organ expansion factor, predicted [Heracleum sosnowskyi]
MSRLQLHTYLKTLNPLSKLVMGKRQFSHFQTAIAHDKESSQIDSDGSKKQRPELVGVIRETEGAGTYADYVSHSDVECDLNVMASTSKSSFDEHFGYKLSIEEIKDLTKGKRKDKWKEKWEVAANNMSRCKWIGTGEPFMEKEETYKYDGLERRLYKHWLTHMPNGGTYFHSSKQRSFFFLCNSYRDILHHDKKPFYMKGVEEDSSIMDAYIMHSLNHLCKSRDLVTKNDAEVSKPQVHTKDDIPNSVGFRDRGFTSPKILILLPLASIAFRVVNRLIELTPSKHKAVDVENLDRFSDEFGKVTNCMDEAENSQPRKSSHPSDFHALFGGNNNDNFMIGIKISRGSVKLYDDINSSDMIVASPLCLNTKIGEAVRDKKNDTDYLSSIEVLIVDHADVIAKQNWSHLSTVIKKLNNKPSKKHGTEQIRIRPWYLDGHAQFYRQSIILGSHLSPEINALIDRHCLNYQGKVKLECNYKGVLRKVSPQVRQIYEKFVANSIGDVDGARFAYFTTKVFPKIKNSFQGGTMIFISSSFEFVRVQKFLESQKASFCHLGENAEQIDVSHEQVWHHQESKKILLYTEKSQFYHRYKIHGVRNLIIYSLPERKEFYPELVNMLQGSDSLTATVLFCGFDMLRLEAVVGSDTAKTMTNSDKDVFIVK